jgi:hypothetical protein
MTKRIIIIHFSGNVGKTTLAANLLATRIPDCKIFNVDTLNKGLNDSGIDAEKLRADQFSTVRDELFISDNVIVDVGASSAEIFTQFLKDYSDCHNDVDAFIVPIGNTAKQLDDTYETIMMLLSLGTDPAKIKPVFNMVPRNVNVVLERSEIIEWLKVNGIVFNEKAIVYLNDFYQRNTIGASMEDLVDDKNNYKEMIRKTTDESKRKTYILMHCLRELAGKTKENMDEVFSALFGQNPVAENFKEDIKKVPPASNSKLATATC